MNIEDIKDLHQFDCMVESNEFSTVDIAKILGCSKNSITKWARIRNLTFKRKSVVSIITEDGLTQELIKKILDYNPDTGIWHWKEYRGGFADAGTIAGTLHPTGYININLYGKKYPAHQLVSLYMEGYLPLDKGLEVDHINHIRHDNRYKNLRPCSHAENSRNQSSRKKDTDDIKQSGVYKQDSKVKRYIVDITYNKERFRHGPYYILENAISKAKRIYKQCEYHENHGRTQDELEADW